MAFQRDFQETVLILHSSFILKIRHARINNQARETPDFATCLSKVLAWTGFQPTCFHRSPVQIRLEEPSLTTLSLLTSYHVLFILLYSRFISNKRKKRVKKTKKVPSNRI